MHKKRPTRRELITAERAKEKNITEEKLSDTVDNFQEKNLKNSFVNTNKHKHAKSKHAKVSVEENTSINNVFEDAWPSVLDEDKNREVDFIKDEKSVNGGFSKEACCNENLEIDVKELEINLEKCSSDSATSVCERNENLLPEDQNSNISYRKYSILYKTILFILQVTLTIALPICGIVNSPLSSFVPSETYESMLSKVESAKLQSQTNLNKVVTSQSRFKVRAGANNACTPENSANGNMRANKKFTLQWPLYEDTFTQTSPFGYRSDPATGRNVLHSGIDMAGPVDTPIMAIADGVVSKADVYGGAGRIVVDHNINGHMVQSWYLHMYSNGIYVKVGQNVKRGEVIAGIGSSGYSTGPHLHFEIHPNGGGAVDPERWLKENRAVLLSKQC